MSDFCPQAVIFDMDGLLVDSEPVWAVAEGAMMNARGKQSDPEIQRSLIGLRMTDFLGGMRKAYDLTDSIEDLVADILERMVTLIPERVVPRGAEFELEALECGVWRRVELAWPTPPEPSGDSDDSMSTAR